MPDPQTVLALCVSCSNNFQADNHHCRRGCDARARLHIDFCPECAKEAIEAFERQFQTGEKK